MDYITIPNTCKHLYPGSVVMLGRFPGTKWVLQLGWYIHENMQLNGWYFSAIPSRSTIPVEESDLQDLVLISEGTSGCDCGCPAPIPPYPKPPMPPGRPPVRPVEVYISGVQYVKGQLIWLESGKLYQASKDFVSSRSESTVFDNLKTDITLGNLVPASTDDISGGAWVFAIKFQETFNTDVLTKDKTDAFLRAHDPEITPMVGIMFINIDSESESYLDSYQYCITKHESGLDQLVLLKVFTISESIPISELDKILI